MEDILIGRNLDSQALIVPFTNAVISTLVPANPQRVRLLVFSGANQFNIGPHTVTITTVAGLRVGAGSQVTILTIEDVGNMLQQQWDIIGTGSTSFCMVIDVSLQAKKASDLR